MEGVARAERRASSPHWGPKGMLFSQFWSQNIFFVYNTSENMSVNILWRIFLFLNIFFRGKIVLENGGSFALVFLWEDPRLGPDMYQDRLHAGAKHFSLELVERVQPIAVFGDTSCTKQANWLKMYFSLEIKHRWCGILPLILDLK